MKSKTNLKAPFILLLTYYALVIITLAAGCSSRGPRFVTGDHVVVTSNGTTATGTVVRSELGMNLDRECSPNMLYYQIRFGSVLNNKEDLNIAWFPGKCLKKQAP